MINFFYGKNGTGKSTLAKAFKDGSAALTWEGDPYPESRILIYNEDFIVKNVQSYGTYLVCLPFPRSMPEKNRKPMKKLLKRKP
jgi:AAA15 family ATPase/GTPase